MSYTKSDLQLSDACLLNAILELGNTLKKTDKKVSDKLLFNFNTYNEIQLSDMMTSFQCLFVKSIDCPLGILDIESLIENDLDSVKDVITGGLCESVMPKPVLKRAPT
jgi:hypothetical protein